MRASPPYLGYGDDAIFDQTQSQSLDQPNATEMPSTGERRVQPDLYEFQGQFHRNRALTERKHVRIVVFSRPARGVEAPTERAAYPSDFVGHHRLPIP